MPPDNEKNFPRDIEASGPLKNKEDSRKESFSTLDSGANIELVEKKEEQISHEGDRLRKKDVREVENKMKQYEVYLRLNSPALAIQVLNSVLDAVKQYETISMVDKENLLLQLSNKYKEHGDSKKSKEALMLAHDLSEKNVLNDKRMIDARVAKHVYDFTLGDTEEAFKTRESNKQKEEIEKREKEEGDQHNIAA